jgi:hypothetical protein
MVELYLQFPIHLPGMTHNYLSKGTAYLFNKKETHAVIMKYRQNYHRLQ